MGNKFITLVMVVGLLIAAAPAMAHHGDGSTFGGGAEINVKGTVTEWFWANPHCLLKFDVKGDDGQVQHWVGETQSPATIFASGWNKFMFKPGDQITVTVRPVKNRKFVGPIDGVLSRDRGIRVHRLPRRIGLLRRIEPVEHQVVAELVAVQGLPRAARLRAFRLTHR